MHCRPGCLAVVVLAAIKPNLGRVVKVHRLCTPPESRRFSKDGYVWEVEASDAMLWREGAAYFSSRRGSVPDVQLKAIHPWPKEGLPPQYYEAFAQKWKLKTPIPIRDHRIATGLSMLSERLDITIPPDDPMRACAAMVELSLYRMLNRSAPEGEATCEF